MTAPQSRDVSGSQPSGTLKFALVATCIMFAVAFGTMVVLSLVQPPGAQLDAVVDTCRWIVAITAATIVGLVTQGKRP